MKKIYLLVVLAFICLKISVKAQDLPNFGLSGGYTYPSGVYTDIHDFTYKPVYNGGIFAEFDRLDHLFINTGFMFSQEETGPIVLKPEVKDPKDFASNMMFEYVDIYGRMKWSYQIVKHINFYYTAGLYAGYLFYGSYTNDNKTIYATSNMHRANGGPQGGIGLNFQISKIKIDIGAIGEYGFFYTVKDLPYRGTIYAAGVLTTIGISYPLDLE